MSGISRLSAMMIKDGDARASAGLVVGETKWRGYIDFYKDGQPHICPLISTPPHYETEEQAIEAMKNVITEVKKMEMP